MTSIDLLLIEKQIVGHIAKSTEGLDFVEKIYSELQEDRTILIVLYVTEVGKTALERLLSLAKDIVQQQVAEETQPIYWAVLIKEGEKTIEVALCLKGGAQFP